MPRVPPPPFEPSEPEAVRVILVAEDPLVRGGLLTRLGGAGDLEVVAEVGSLSEARALWTAGGAEVVVWDLGLRAEPFLPELAELSEDELAPPWVVLAPDERSAREAQSREADGVLGRGGDGAALAAAVRAVALGLRVVDRAWALPASASPGESPPRDAPQGSTLTPRELQVLRELAEGRSNKEIAQRLSISEHTAKFHVNAILQKLGVQKRTEAVVRAARLGYVVL
jgi:DNA-binding NarL/FixJ family response regulator